MTSPTDQANSVSAVSSKTDESDARSLPGVFLMINSFETGGSERQFTALSTSLDPASFRVELGCIMERGAFRAGLGEVATFPVRGSLYRTQSVKSRLRLARHLRDKQIAIAHAFDFYANLMLIPAARLGRTPVVIGSQRQLGDLLTRPQFYAQLTAFRWCDRVICNSQVAASRLIEHGLQASKAVVIGNGLPETAFARTDPLLPKKKDVLRVGMIGRMNAAYKNHHVLLAAVAALGNKFPQLEVVLAGDGPLRPHLEQVARDLGIAASVRFLGDCRDIPSVLASVDVSVIPSASESLSNVVLESMAAGVPVIATNVGGNPELVNSDRGLLVPEGDAAGLSQALEVLLRNPNRAELGSAGRAFAGANFTLEQSRKKHEQLYAELLDEKRWRPRSFSRPGKRLRVAIVAPSLRYVGGQSVQADLLLRHWRGDAEVDARLLAVDPRFPLGLRWLERIPLLRTIIREPLYMLALWRGLKNVDVAHIFSASYWSFLLAPAPALAMARLRGVKAVLNYHSGEARDHLRRFRTALPILHRADRVVVPSGYLVDVFHEFGLQAEVVPNFVDLSQFSFRLRNPLRPHLVCTRGFHSYYSIDVVVRAFARVQKEYPEARLDLVGGGPTEESVRSLVTTLNLRGVNFAGVASRQEISSFYDQADIFVNASWLDNMPLSILEAFASGTPVVTTAPECMPYLVEDKRSGLLSPVGDADALAENVICLLQNPVLAKDIATNAHDQLRRYDWATVRREWLRVYHSLARTEGRDESTRILTTARG